MGKVATNGRQFMDREADGESTPLHQVVRTELDEEAASFEVLGIESGQRRLVRSTDPGAIAHLRERDHAEFVVSLAERPAVAEPQRVPMPGRPGTRTCWLCGGVGEAEGIEGWERCAQCGGEGVIGDESILHDA